MTNEEINIYLISGWVNSSKSGLIKITRNNELSLNKVYGAMAYPDTA